MLENVTIIVFTRNRYVKASIVVKFWLRHGAQILLLDASSNSNLEEAFAMKKNVIYFRAPSIWERALFASSNLATTYALIHSDDSLVFPSTVMEGISRFENNDEVGFLYAPGNFSSWWFEDSSWEYSNKLSGDTPYKRMSQWAKKPNDLMWGALWRSVHLKQVLKVWGESMSVFPFECNLHTTSLYLSGAALTSGQILDKPLHLSRHWQAPVDESLVMLRSQKNPFGLDLTKSENCKRFNLWKTKLLNGINKQLESKEQITLEELHHLLWLYESNDPNLGLKLRGGVSLYQRMREKCMIQLKKLVKEKSISSSIAARILMLIKQFKLIVNCVNKRRCGWFECRLLNDFTKDELVNFEIETEKYSKIKMNNYHKLFIE